MDVQYAPVNGIEIAYETFGSPSDPPILLVMGLGTQMIAWPDPLCEGLAGRGHYVVRFDNRDVGLSTHLTDAPSPRLSDVVLRRQPPPYTVDDMADDAVGLMDHLDLGTVHLVGASMGGFIAQTIALRYPQRLRSLTLMMTSTGSRRVGNPKPALFTRLTRGRVVADRAGAQERALETFRIIGSRGYAFDEQYMADLAGRSYDRAHDPGGYFRQLSAIVAQPDRTSGLRSLTMPALVIHGLHDPLVAFSGGVAAARLLPRAKFVGYSGMGHDLPRELWPDFETEIATLAARAESRPMPGESGTNGPVVHAARDAG
jgi:pimeloyl-ACP methyl ester carboxylesterase